MHLIGLDIGTTSICAVLTDSETGKILKSITKSNDSFIKTDREWEKIQSCEKIYSTIEEILSEIYDEKVSAIGISNQMHGILYVDSSANALSPLYIWQDARADLPYKNSTYSKQFGAPAGYGLATDYYNELNSLIPEKAVKLVTIGDYTAMRLTGETGVKMHISNAGSLGKFDVKTNSFTIDNPRLPAVTAKFETVGYYKGKTPVCCAIGDNQASFLGSVRGYGALLNVGTGSQISFTTDSAYSIDSIEIRPLDGEKYLGVGAALCGGRAFSLLEKLISSVTGENAYPVIDKILETKTTTDLIADTRFCGTRSDPSIRGSITNISESNFTLGDIALAILNGMTDELYDMFSSSGNKCTSLVGSGNGIRKNKTLKRIAGKKFGCEIKIPVHSEEASFGAALTAGVASGIFKDINEAQNLIKYQGE